MINELVPSFAWSKPRNKRVAEIAEDDGFGVDVEDEDSPAVYQPVAPLARKTAYTKFYEDDEVECFVAETPEALTELVENYGFESDAVTQPRVDALCCGTVRESVERAHMLIDALKSSARVGLPDKPYLTLPPLFPCRGAREMYYCTSPVANNAYLEVFGVIVPKKYPNAKFGFGFRRNRSGEYPRVSGYCWLTHLIDIAAKVTENSPHYWSEFVDEPFDKVWSQVAKHCEEVVLSPEVLSYTEAQLWWNGVAETPTVTRSEVDKLKEYISKGMCFWDVGCSQRGVTNRYVSSAFENTQSDTFALCLEALDALGDYPLPTSYSGGSKDDEMREAMTIFCARLLHFSSARLAHLMKGECREKLQSLMTKYSVDGKDVQTAMLMLGRNEGRLPEMDALPFMTLNDQVVEFASFLKSIGVDFESPVTDDGEKVLDVCWLSCYVARVYRNKTMHFVWLTELLAGLCNAGFSSAVKRFVEETPQLYTYILLHSSEFRDEKLLSFLHLLQGINGLDPKSVFDLTPRGCRKTLEAVSLMDAVKSNLHIGSNPLRSFAEEVRDLRGTFVVGLDLRTSDFLGFVRAHRLEGAFERFYGEEHWKDLNVKH